MNATSAFQETGSSANDTTTTANEAGASLRPKQPESIRCPVTVGQKQFSKELHMKHVPTAIDFAPMHLLDDFNCNPNLPAFQVLPPEQVDLHELVKTCTFYTRDQIFSIMEFAQRNSEHDFYLWKKIEGQSNFVIFFSDDDPENICVYKFFINCLELVLVTHAINDMHHVYHTDYIVSEKKDGAVISIQERKKGLLSKIIESLQNRFAFSLN
ncbi:MAG TPA: hypothetical protein PKZ56_02850 [Candidatus Paceibacterota bacterium]|nr:hypothetical protein [Candidatus Paceibacterota bacterium]